MKLRFGLLVLVLPMVLSGCAAAVVYDGTRKGAKRVIGEILVARNPGVDAAEAAECALAGMTVAEILSLGGRDTTVVTQQAVDVVDEVAARPDVASCIDALPRAAQ